MVVDDGASQEEKADFGKDGHCPICYSTEAGPLVHLATCEHIFHRDCIEMYLENKVKSRDLDIICPMD